MTVRWRLLVGNGKGKRAFETATRVAVGLHKFYWIRFYYMLTTFQTIAVTIYLVIATVKLIRTRILPILRL